jgi:hypothetical protein
MAICPQRRLCAWGPVSNPVAMMHGLRYPSLSVRAADCHPRNDDMTASVAGSHLGRTR